MTTKSTSDKYPWPESVTRAPDDVRRAAALDAKSRKWEFGPQTREEALSDYATGLLTPMELDAFLTHRFAAVSEGEVIIPREMRVGDVLEPTFGMHGPFTTAVVESVGEMLVHLARPYAFVDRTTANEHRGTLLQGVERYPVELSARHLTYTLVRREA